MKIWKYYLKPEKETDNPNYDIEDRYPLYAITNNKKLAEKFKRSRNMKKFIETKAHVDKESYIEYINRNRSFKLVEYGLKTWFQHDKFDKDAIYEVDVVMTEMERSTVEDGLLEFEDISFWVNAPKPYMFEDKYVEALRTLEYIRSMKIFGHATSFMDYDDKDSDYSAPTMTKDELSLFSKMYYRLMK